MKYVGRLWKNPQGGNTVVAIHNDGLERILPSCTKIMNHSPNGFSWGYSGSGPAQLALAILCDFFSQLPGSTIEELKCKAGQGGEEEPPTLERLSWPDWLAIRSHQAFKAALIAKLPPDDGFTITDEQIAEILGIRIEPPEDFSEPKPKPKPKPKPD